MSYFEAAAAQGNIQAQVNLGIVYLTSGGPVFDQARARRHLEPAALFGSGSAQFLLANLMGDPSYEDHDVAEAYRWLLILEPNLDQTDIERARFQTAFKDFASRLTTEERRDIKLRAQRFKALK